jgi:tripartite-type tricarboxylate transporter receptor subunit TctC
MLATGTKLTIVNYNGGAPAMTDLLSGNVQVVLFNLVNVTSMIKSGRLRGLVVSGARRDAGLPDVPTFAEIGMKDFDPAGPLQYPMLAPSKTPRDIIEKLNGFVRKALAYPEVVGKLAQQGVTPAAPISAAEADKLYRSEMERYGKLVKDAGLKPGSI